MGFEEAQKRVAPAWLQDEDSQTWIGFTGTQKQIQFDLLKLGIKARWPTICPDDALSRTGHDSDLERFSADTEATYRARQLARWETWPFAGTERGLEASLVAFGVECEVYEWWEWQTPEQWYSKFWPVLGPDTPFDPLDWGDFDWGDDTWGSTATVSDVDTIKRQVIKWKGAHGIPMRIVLSFAGTTLWGVDVWGSFTWGGEAPCQWLMMNTWSDSIYWGGFEWGNAHDWPA